MKLYYIPPSPNSQGPLAVVRELGIDCELVNAYGKTRTPEYLAMNPCHCAPMVEVADGMAIWESATVMRYLCNVAENGDKLYPTDPLKRAQIDLALDWRQTSLYPCLPSIGYICFGMDCDDEVAKEKFKELLETHFKTLAECFLKDTKFVFSDTPTIADLSIALPLTFIKARHNFWDLVPGKVQEYYEAVKAAFPHSAEEFGMIENMCTSCEHPSAKLELELE